MDIFVYQRQPTSQYAFEKGTATARRVSPYSSLAFRNDQNRHRSEGKTPMSPDNQGARGGTLERGSWVEACAKRITEAKSASYG